MMMMMMVMMIALAADLKAQQDRSNTTHVYNA